MAPAGFNPGLEGGRRTLPTGRRTPSSTLHFYHNSLLYKELCLPGIG
jgi:hypothetical protein